MLLKGEIMKGGKREGMRGGERGGTNKRIL
jgi:hypothetical protein